MGNRGADHAVSAMPLSGDSHGSPVRIEANLSDIDTIPLKASQMDSKMPSWAKYAIAAAIVAILVVVARSYQEQNEEDAWAVIGSEGVLRGDVEAMEAARQQVRGTSAGPLLSLMLAQRLYELGGNDNFERARQVARQAVEDDPDHALATKLSKLLAALETFEVAPAADA